MITTIEKTVEAMFDPDEFLRDSPVWLDIQQTALRTNLLRIANEQGLELLRIRHDHHPVVELSLYVGNEHENRTSLRCRSMVCDLLRLAGMNVRKNKVFARYRRSVIRSAVALDW